MRTRTKDQRRLYKLLFLFVKYLPPFTTICLTIHGAICLLGINESVLDNLVKISILRTIFMVVCSYAFGFCRLHRICVIFNLIVSTLITIHNEIGLGYLLAPCEALAVLCGMIIFTLLVTHWQGFKRCNGNVRENFKWTLRQNQ